MLDAAGGSAVVHGYSSGALLALHAVLQGLAIPKVSLLEPPLELDDRLREEPDLEREITELVAAGRRGDAVEHFNRSIGVPEEYLVGMRDAPWWPAMEGMAHTLVYDLVISRTLPVAELGTVATPALVLASNASDARLRRWARGLSEALPGAAYRELAGEWHGVPPEALAAAMAEFVSGDRSKARR